MLISRQTLQQCVLLLDKFLISLFVQMWLLTWLCVFLHSHWGGEIGSPPLMTGDFVIGDRGYIGGRGIARLPLRWGRIAPQALLLTMPVCTSGGKGHSFSLTTTAASSEEEGQALLLTMSVSSSDTDGTLRRYHDQWVAYDLHTGAGLYRSGRSAIPCGGCAWSFMVNIRLACRRSGRFDDTFRSTRPGNCCVARHLCKNSNRTHVKRERILNCNEIIQIDSKLNSAALPDTRDNISTTSLFMSHGEVPRFWRVAFATLC